jgi:hypothetical protein
VPGDLRSRILAWYAPMHPKSMLCHANPPNSPKQVLHQPQHLTTTNKPPNTCIYASVQLLAGWITGAMTLQQCQTGPECQDNPPATSSPSTCPPLLQAIAHRVEQVLMAMSPPMGMDSSRERAGKTTTRVDNDNKERQQGG